MGKELPKSIGKTLVHRLCGLGFLFGFFFVATAAQAQDLSDFTRTQRFIWGSDDTFNKEQQILREEARAVWTQMRMPMECRPAAHEISETLYQYRKDLRQHRDDVARAKVTQALAILEKQDRCFHSVAAFYGLWSLGSGFIDIEHSLPLYLELYSRGKLVPVRSSARSGHKSMLGAYQCQTSTIYFDPFHGPEDVRNILIHEITHLIRDKFVFNENLPARLPRLTAIEYSIVDETLAVLSGTLGQLDEDPKWHRDFDLSLFRDNGSLVGSIRAANRGIDVPGNYVIRPSYDLHRYMKIVGLTPKHEPYLRHIIGLVASVYAPKAKYRLNVLVDWLKQYDYAEDGFWTNNRWKYWNWTDGAKYKTMDEVFARPSKVCDEFVKQIRKGELRHYLGTQDSKEKDKKPETDATKPGTDGVRPGTDGVRPGTDGIRPGLEKTKWAPSGIRLCRPPPPEL